MEIDATTVEDLCDLITALGMSSTEQVQALEAKITDLEVANKRQSKDLKIKAQRVAIVTEEALKWRSKAKSFEAQLKELNGRHDVPVLELEKELENTLEQFSDTATQLVLCRGDLALKTGTINSLEEVLVEEKRRADEGQAELEKTLEQYSETATQLVLCRADLQSKRSTISSLEEALVIEKRGASETKGELAASISLLQEQERLIDELGVELVEAVEAHATIVAKLETRLAEESAMKEAHIAKLESLLKDQSALIDETRQTARTANSILKASHVDELYQKDRVINGLEASLARQSVAVDEATRKVQTVDSKIKTLFGIQSHVAEIALATDIVPETDTINSLRSLKEYSPQAMSCSLRGRWQETINAQTLQNDTTQENYEATMKQLDETHEANTFPSLNTVIDFSIGSELVLNCEAKRAAVIEQLEVEIAGFSAKQNKAAATSITSQETETHNIAWEEHNRSMMLMIEVIDVLIAQAVAEQKLSFINHQQDRNTMHVVELKYTASIELCEASLADAGSQIDRLTQELEEMTNREHTLDTKFADALSQISELETTLQQKAEREQDLIAEVADRQRDHQYLLKSILQSAVTDGSIAVLNKVFLQAHKTEERDKLPVDATLGFYCLSTRDMHKWSLLHKAVDGGHPKVVEVLLNMGLDINSTTVTGETPLHFAVSHQYREIVKILVSRGANLGATKAKSDQRTPLHIAARRGHEELVDILLDEGANVHAEAMALRTPLHMAVIGGHQFIVNTLLGRGADVNACDFQKWTPLHFAADLGDVSMVTLLLDRGANVYAKVVGGATCLHLSAERGQLDVVRALVSRSALVGARDDTGSTAEDWATAENHSDVVTFLQISSISSP